LAEIFSLFGHLVYLSLLCNIVDAYLVYCGAKWCATFLEACRLHIDEIYLVVEGLILLSCGIGKEFSAFAGNFFLFHANLV
jgi:hypothetical protein